MRTRADGDEDDKAERGDENVASLHDAGDFVGTGISGEGPGDRDDNGGEWGRGSKETSSAGPLQLINDGSIVPSPNGAV